MIDYFMLLALIGLPVAALFLVGAGVLLLGYEIEATLWSMPF